jgi:hypothetical protein
MKTKQAAEKPIKPKPTEPYNLQKRIGSTTYEVSIHFSKTSKETIGDKIIRLMKMEAL